MIVVTGATGFIGSSLIQKLNAENFKAIVAVDHFDSTLSDASLKGAIIQERVERHDFIQWLDRFQPTVEFVFHLDTVPCMAQSGQGASQEGNMEYAKAIWNKCASYQIPLIYTSSATIYGVGEAGFDEHIPFDRLNPLDDWGQSTLNFDKWATHQQKAPFYWAGLRLFTVYGPNDCYQDAPTAVVHTIFKQITTTGTATLHKSYNPHYRDGEQMRDFVHVRDVVNTCFFLMHYRKHAGLYNVGSGRAKSFLHLTKIMFQMLGKEEAIEFTDIPACRRHTHPYFVEAQMSKLRRTGFSLPFYTLEEGICDYLQHYLGHRIK